MQGYELEGTKTSSFVTKGMVNHNSFKFYNSKSKIFSLIEMKCLNFYKSVRGSHSVKIFKFFKLDNETERRNCKYSCFKEREIKIPGFYTSQ
jgi:hypothetical protein